MPRYPTLPKFASVALSRYTRLPTVLHIELNEPKTFNSLSPSMFQSWTGAIQWAASEPSVHAVVVSGRGKAGAADKARVFCSGMHMNKDVQDALSAGKPPSLASSRAGSSGARGFIDALIDFPKLIVAAVNGHCFGMGVTMLPLHDFVFALPGRTFKTPFSELGVCAEGCSSVFFPQILGPGLANRMLLQSQPQTAETLAPSGFITEVVDTTPDALPGYALSFVADMLGVPDSVSQEEILGASEYTNLSLDSILRSKALIRTKEERARLHQINERELEQVSQMVSSPEFRDGLGRFMAKQMRKKAAAAAKL